MDNTPPPLPKNVVVVFRYAGGPKDGIEVRSDQPPTDGHMDAESLWMVTRGGRVGTKQRMTSDYTIADAMVRGVEALKDGGVLRHVYVLEGREEFPGELILTFNYVAADDSPVKESQK